MGQGNSKRENQKDLDKRPEAVQGVLFDPFSEWFGWRNGSGIDGECSHSRDSLGSVCKSIDSVPEVAGSDGRLQDSRRAEGEGVD